MSPSSKSQDGTPLRPRARIIRILGEELISNEMVAVIELVKNSYDADATKVLVRFTGPLEPGMGCIEILDNGHGMSLDTVLTAFMEPATNAKRGGKAKRRSEELGRRMLGEKGIGRFASARLASELELITRRKGASTEVFAVFDWTQFDNDELYLDEVHVLTETRDPEQLCPTGAARDLWRADENPSTRQMSRGTILRMTGLRRAWSRQDIISLRRGLSRLVSPFAKIPDFEIILALPEEFADLSEPVQPPKLIKYPHYSVRGHVAEDGSFELGYRVHALEDTRKVEKGRFLFSDDSEPKALTIKGEDTPEDTRQPQCGPLDLELRFWDRDELGNVHQKLGSTILDVRRDLNAIAGINIHRDGFRVLPYGEPNNDWLRLDLRRVQKPQERFSNNNIAGYVSISADANSRLVDQTNREGLDNNQAYYDLERILTTIIGGVETRRQRLRPRKTGTRSTTPTGGLFQNLDLDDLRQYVAQEYPNDKEAEQIIDSAQNRFSGRLEEIQEVLARYHSLATLGQLIDIVLHDGRHPVAKIKYEAGKGMGDIDGVGPSPAEILPQLRGRFVVIDTQANIVSTVFRRIEPFSGRRRGRPSQLILEKMLQNCFSIFESKIAAQKVQLVLPRTETLVRLDEAEFQEVITNLLDNSLYWLQHVPERKRKIQVDVRRLSDGSVEIIFADSGPGIDVELRERIFDAYFSTKPDGIGLGLAIAGEIVKDYYHGDVELMGSHPLGGAAFRILLRKRV